MVGVNQFAEIGLLVGEPARAAMLLALMDGRALTASELAEIAHITPQTASAHLARLVRADLLSVVKQGRHRYHRLASSDVAGLIENILQLAGQVSVSSTRLTTGPKDQALRHARTCYDHFAGRLGVAITESLVAQEMITFDGEKGEWRSQGQAFFQAHGIDILTPGQRPSTRPLCRPCLDWSERKTHVAGQVGAAICTHFINKTYVRRIKGARALAITPKGHKALFDLFGIRDFGRL
ncbi:MAG TPA: ArsR family transcriptional regulator [Hellea balneolensis]|uniref:ArsR family transcriptional regulator n=1 Tax=Hellea balneolensis TaxID=287478 RepID=A0A7C3GBF7_9PROT|nr:ArsR family transcriptional regulator [Hellea balneolensis]